MGLENIAEYGIAIFALAAMCFSYKSFLSALKEQRESFKNTIDNHIEHNTAAIDKNSEALDGLKDILKEVCFWVKKSNGNSRKK